MSKAILTTLPPIPFPIKKITNNVNLPFFSIITVTYNSNFLFDRTALSLQHQICRDFEWIVIDGGSVDGTVQKIKRHEVNIDYWISEKDEGIADAWNKGLSVSQGRYILFLNAGDIYDPDFLEKIRSIYADDMKILCSHARLITQGGDYVGTFYSHPHKLYRGMHLAHNWCAVPRIHYETLGGYRHLPLAMDFDWFHRYYCQYGGEGFNVMDCALGNYHLGGISDVNYAKSFRFNSVILIDNGTPRLIAGLWRFLYTAKHAWKTWRVKGFLK